MCDSQISSNEEPSEHHLISTTRAILSVPMLRWIFAILGFRLILYFGVLFLLSMNGQSISVDGQSNDLASIALTIPIALAAAMALTQTIDASFWFPQQSMYLAMYFDATNGRRFADIDPRVVVSTQYSSGSGGRGLPMACSKRQTTPGARWGKLWGLISWKGCMVWHRQSVF